MYSFARENSSREVLMSFAMAAPANNFSCDEKTRCTEQRKELSGCRLHAVGLLGRN